jgi:hypothetical protein
LSYVDNISESFENLSKKIVVYYPYRFSITGGGSVALIYFAQYINKMYNDNIVSVYSLENDNINENGIIFNNFIKNDDFDKENTIVIYAEGIEGNPLNAKHVIRWILADLYITTREDIYKTWNDNDLVYYYNREEKFYESPEKIGVIYKQLSLIYLNPLIYNNNNNNNVRKYKYCHTYRKSNSHTDLNIIHPYDSFEIKRELSFQDTLDIFKEHEYFVCYDPFSFLAIIAIFSGCITIIHPYKNLNKTEYLKLSPLWDYLEKNNINNFYGLAYGLDDIEYAKKTINKSKELIEESINFTNNKYTKLFLKDLNNIDDNLKNTVINNYGKTNN